MPEIVAARSLCETCVLRCCRKNAPPYWCKTVHIGGGPGDDHMRFELDFCSCGAVEALYDGH